MMRGLDLDLRWGRGGQVVSSLLFGEKPSRPIGNMVETQVEGRERERRGEVYLAWTVMSWARGQAGPGVCVSQSVPATRLFPFIPAGTLPVLGAGPAF